MIIPIVGVMKGDLSNYRLFVPRPFVTKNERSLWGTFIPRTFRSREISFLRTFVPGNFKSSRERKFVLGTKVPHRDLSFLGTKDLGHKFPKVGKSLGTNLLIIRIDSNRRWEEGILAGLV